MRYKLLGKSGLRVSELCLGTMTFGEEWGWGANRDESKKIFDAYVNAGGNFLDTANRYTEGTSEILCGDFMGSDRDTFVLATKYSLTTRRGDINASGNHRKNMVQAVEASLKRLNTHYIDLYWLHAWDSTTPADEVMRALEDLVRVGKVLHIGVSDTPAWIVAQCNTLAELRGWSQFVALQIEYSLLQRTPERELVPMAHEFGLALTPWAPLAGGALTGKYLQPDSSPKRIKPESARLNERNTGIVKRVVEIAAEAGCTPTHLAINWLRQQPGVVVPIIGARTAEQLQQSMNCLQHSISPEHMTALNEISAIELGFPHEFLRSDGVSDILFSGEKSKLDM